VTLAIGADKYDALITCVRELQDRALVLASGAGKYNAYYAYVRELQDLALVLRKIAEGIERDLLWAQEIKASTQLAKQNTPRT
jgi:hypothetical protein